MYFIANIVSFVWRLTIIVNPKVYDGYIKILIQFDAYLHRANYNCKAEIVFSGYIKGKEKLLI